MSDSTLMILPRQGGAAFHPQGNRIEITRRYTAQEKERAEQEEHDGASNE